MKVAPTWPSGSDDDDMGLESISEPDDLDMDMEGEDAEGEPFFESIASPCSSGFDQEQVEREHKEKQEGEETDPGTCAHRSTPFTAIQQRTLPLPSNTC